jgi:hypothetical protein
MWVYDEEISYETLGRYEFSFQCDNEFTVDSNEGKGKAISIQA